MALPSAFSILKAGIGPSSSHTFGPCLAALDFRGLVAKSGALEGRIAVRLMGSLALTGKGHLTDWAVAAGLAGFDPSRDERTTIQGVYREVTRADVLRIGEGTFAFAPERDIRFDTAARSLEHPNTLEFRLSAPDGAPLLEETYLSVGGGRVTGGTFAAGASGAEEGRGTTMGDVLQACLREGWDLATYALEAERADHGIGGPEAFDRLAAVWSVMTKAIQKGLATEGMLPGVLMLERRAGELFENYQENIRKWGLLSRDVTLVAIYAMAVAEENAAGGRIVTAPTCGSAGILPATLQMLQERFRLPEKKVLEALLVAGLVGSVAARNASISGAEVGCQGEVGVASAMAAAAAVHCLDGTAPQAECAAELALEHHLGLTCDPIAGLVQVPCIERNSVGAVTALNAANLSLLGSGRHFVSFDATLATLMDVGRDMKREYKETALGGLAARVRLPRTEE
jgi:L-serine dehydratase